MSGERKIYINNDLDVVVARMQAREMARNLGFGTADQARISLAASELARALSWNTGHTGEIVLSPATKNGQQGMQINCLVSQETLTPGDSPGQASHSPGIGSARQLVDESIVETQGNKQARVTLMKWLR